MEHRGRAVGRGELVVGHRPAAGGSLALPVDFLIVLSGPYV